MVRSIQTMSNFERVMIIFIISVFVSTSCAVIKTAYDTREDYRESIIKKQQNIREHLPSVCREYYAKDSEKWRQCMRVEFK